MVGAGPEESMRTGEGGHVAFRVYLSHSVGPHELGAIYGIAELAAKKDMEPIVTDRRWSPEAPPARILQFLKGLDAFVVIATESGRDLPWVNNELSVAIQSGLNAQAVVSVVDEGVTPPPTGRVITIDRLQLPETIRRTVEILEQLNLERNQRNLLAGLLLGGLVALVLASKD
jgi:hypothetical protein